jgi:hypothetical protein
MKGNSGSRFEHDPSVIDYAYQLVKEYDDHQRAEDAKFKRGNPEHVKLIARRQAEAEDKRRSEQ